MTTLRCQYPSRMLYGAQQRWYLHGSMQQLNIINLYKALGGGWPRIQREKARISPNSARDRQCGARVADI